MDHWPALVTICKNFSFQIWGACQRSGKILHLNFDKQTIDYTGCWDSAVSRARAEYSHCPTFVMKTSQLSLSETRMESSLTDWV